MTTRQDHLVWRISTGIGLLFALACLGVAALFGTDAGMIAMVVSMPFGAAAAIWATQRYRQPVHAEETPPDEKPWWLRLAGMSGVVLALAVTAPLFLRTWLWGDEPLSDAAGTFLLLLYLAEIGVAVLIARRVWRRRKRT